MFSSISIHLSMTIYGLCGNRIRSIYSRTTILCEAAKQVYHLCFWCAERITEAFFQSFFGNGSNPAVNNDNVNVDDARCEIWRVRIEGSEMLATMELCELENRETLVCRYV